MFRHPGWVFLTDKVKFEQTTKIEKGRAVTEKGPIDTSPEAKHAEGGDNRTVGLPEGGGENISSVPRSHWVRHASRPCSYERRLRRKTRQGARGDVFIAEHRARATNDDFSRREGGRAGCALGASRRGRHASRVVRCVVLQPECKQDKVEVSGMQRFDASAKGKQILNCIPKFSATFFPKFRALQTLDPSVSTDER